MGGKRKHRKRADSFTPKQRAFVAEYLVDLNATQAAMRAGYSTNGAKQTANILLHIPHVQAALKSAMDARIERTNITADDVLRRWAEIADADPNDLVQYRRGACPKCWPGDSDRDREPNAECEECAGEGVGRAWAADTRKLQGAAKRLYAGLKLSKDGLEIKMQDQMAALVNMARHLGMFPSKVELTGPGGGPLRHAVQNLPDDPAEAARVYKEIMQGGS